jgi:tetratricopeptide (TPR) repeat protein
MKKLLISTALFAATLLLLSCKTIKEIPEDKTSAQIIQMGQNSVSVSDYKSAVFCYETAIERYGSDPALYVEAKYELAHTYLKQKKYDKAYPIYNEILELYDAYGTALPGAYKKLCQIGISQIPEKKLAEIKK